MEYSNLGYGPPPNTMMVPQGYGMDPNMYGGGQGGFYSPNAGGYMAPSPRGNQFPPPAHMARPYPPMSNGGGVPYGAVGYMHPSHMGYSNPAMGPPVRYMPGHHSAPGGGAGGGGGGNKVPSPRSQGHQSPGPGAGPGGPAYFPGGGPQQGMYYGPVMMGTPYISTFSGFFSF